MIGDVRRPVMVNSVKVVGWGDEGAPTSTLGGRKCWGSFLTPTYGVQVSADQ